MIYGDINSVLAGSIFAVKLDVKVRHVEAGLLSYDRQSLRKLNEFLLIIVRFLVRARDSPQQISKMLAVLSVDFEPY